MMGSKGEHEENMTNETTDARVAELHKEIINMQKAFDVLNQELEKWKYFAQRDEMTEVLNKREGMRLLQKEIEIARAMKKSLSICFVDIDELKKVNDCYGHVAGDNLIIDTARIIKQSIRKYDNVFRFGGDEFVIIFPDTSFQAAEEVWCRIERSIMLFNQQATRYTIKVSHGICEYPSDTELSLTQYLAMADIEMYERKKMK